MDPGIISDETPASHLRPPNPPLTLPLTLKMGGQAFPHRHALTRSCGPTNIPGRTGLIPVCHAACERRWWRREGETAVKGGKTGKWQRGRAVREPEAPEGFDGGLQCIFVLSLTVLELWYACLIHGLYPGLSKTTWQVLLFQCSCSRHGSQLHDTEGTPD